MEVLPTFEHMYPLPSGLQPGIRPKVIVLNLRCSNEHLFEGWFASANAFEIQHAAKQVACPSCGSTDVTRRPSAPYVNTRLGQHVTRSRQSAEAGSQSSPAAPTTPSSVPSLTPDQISTALAMLRLAAKQSEDVGERFPEEARRIHYGESDPRSIKGKASADDLGELLDEGIMVLPVPPEETEFH